MTRAKGDGSNGIPVEVYDIQNLSRWLKILRSPSTALRTNGEELMSLVFSVHAEVLEAFRTFFQQPARVATTGRELWNRSQ